MCLARILIVDDEADITDIIKRGLELAGFQVTARNSPTDALSNFAAGEYDLLLIDVRMPEMDGFQLYEKLKEIDGNAKICFLTAFDVDYFDLFKSKFPDIPTRCFIKKPVSLANLTSMVRSELGIHADSSAS